MRKILTLLLALLLLLSLNACTALRSPEISAEAGDTTQQGEKADGKTPEKPEKEEEGSPDETPSSEKQEDVKEEKEEEKPDNEKEEEEEEEEKEEEPLDEEKDEGDKQDTQSPNSGTSDPTPSTGGNSSQNTPPSAHTHKFTVTKQTDATCTSDGTTVSVCSCGAQKTETKSKLGHSMGAWTTTREATSSAEGQKERSCSRCSYKETQKIAKLPAGIPNEYLEVLRLCNVEREKRGLAPFTYYYAGQAAADLRGKEAEKSFSHTRPDGRDWYTVWDDLALGDFLSGENLAKGQTSASQVVTDWMNSEGHRANILCTDANALVVAHVGSSWVQLFVIV